MGWVNRWKSKYVTIDINNPGALGECDYSGFTFNRRDLHKQFEWRGNNLVWTGFMVGTPYMDKPNEQNRPPAVKNDPRAITDPRPPTPYPDPEYPVAGTYKQIGEQLEEDSFYDDNTPPMGPPNYVLPYSDTPIPGWQDPNPVPSPDVVLAELRKVWFQ